ncbi:hypothetical protein RAMLITH_21730 [Ramlibacter sp. RBP-2]|uniref:Uncharacterized protein n=1 Tax=Ramlibacter lithotrophicus TaxID=2606681 RepID=A0A7X6DJP7_9BURK|nr:hypothetical protein [Ramlibacter lithotrophicus]NKE68442.1 hypothetical protein [Ramlibacter lithotrophicus]
MRPAFLVLAALLSGASGVALASSCPMQMKAIDDKLASKPALGAADAQKVKKLRADGEALHKAGKHADSEKALGEAKKILGI